MMLRALAPLALAISLSACGTARVASAPARPAAAPGQPELAVCTLVVKAPPPQDSLRYAYAALSVETHRLRDRDATEAFSVRRSLDKIADVLDAVPAGDGREAAARVRGQVTRLIQDSPSQGERAQATRRALEDAHAVLRRLSEGPHRGDAALRHRVEQLGEAVEMIPDDAALTRVSLAPIVTAVQRTQAAFLALSTVDQRRTRLAASSAHPDVVARATSRTHPDVVARGGAPRRAD